MPNIAIITSSGLFREGICKILQRRLTQYKFTVYSPEDYQLLTNLSHRPDLLIIDVQINMDIIKLIDYYTNQIDFQIAVWIANPDEDMLKELFRQGLNGYFYEDMSEHELVFAIKEILNGENYIHPKAAQILLNIYQKKPRQTDNTLTKREWDVLDLMVKGKNNRTISENLAISEKTVKNHVSAILRKLNVSDRLNAVLYALRMKWFVL